MKVEIHKGNLIVANNAKLCKNFFFKARGLMFTKPLSNGSALILESPTEGILDTSIHMMFVFYPLNIVWLNSNKEVVDIQRKVRPFKLWLSPKKPAKYVLELPCSTNCIKLGDKLEFKQKGI